MGRGWVREALGRRGGEGAADVPVEFGEAVGSYHPRQRVLAFRFLCSLGKVGGGACLSEKPQDCNLFSAGQVYWEGLGWAALPLFFLDASLFFSPTPGGIRSCGKGARDGDMFPEGEIVKRFVLLLCLLRYHSCQRKKTNRHSLPTR